jgi:lipase chaperone LimK
MFPMRDSARQRPGRLALASVALLVLGGLIAWWRSHDVVTADGVQMLPASSTDADMRAAGSVARAATPAAVSARVVTMSQETVVDWPASLRDSAPDGAVTLDADGRVRASVELRRLFDYFLTALGERDIAAIRSLLRDHVRALHGDAVAADVAALFDRYVDYQQALAAMSAPPGESLRARLDRVRDLRRRLLDPAMADAFFGDEERYTDYTLDRRDLMADPSIDARARDMRLRELESRLSPEQRASQQEANVAVLVDEQNRQFDALRLDPAQRQAEREALFGAEAAARLAAADAEIAAWDARMRAYVQARDAIRADARLDAASRDRAITALMSRSFDAAEQRRVRSLEAVGQW